MTKPDLPSPPPPFRQIMLEVPLSLYLSWSPLSHALRSPAWWAARPLYTLLCCAPMAAYVLAVLLHALVYLRDPVMAHQRRRLLWPLRLDTTLVLLHVSIALLQVTLVMLQAKI